MARITRAAPHLSAEELKRRFQQEGQPWRRLRWLIIYNAVVDPRAAAEIAKHTGTTVNMVHQVIARYNRLGVAAIETAGKGGRRRQSMSWEAEQAVLAPFFERAERGEIATTGEIQRAFEAQAGHPVHKSTISRLLNRHGWRKLAPRPRHPKADAAAQEQFKKTSRPAWRPPSRRATQKINARS